MDLFVSAREKHRMARLIVSQGNPQAGVRSIQNGIEAHMGKRMRHLLLVEKGGIRSGAEVRCWTYESEKKIGFCVDKNGVALNESDYDEVDGSLYA